MRALTIPLLFLLMPLAEIAAFVFVGREIGIGMTLLLVLASVVVGALLLKVQGLGALRQIQDAARTGTDPGRPLVHGVTIVIAAFLLIVPGFISDVVGLLLFIPAVRDLGWSLIKSRITIVATGNGTGFSTAAGRRGKGDTRSGPRVIDLDGEEFSRTDKDDETGDGRQDRLR